MNLAEAFSLSPVLQAAGSAARAALLECGFTLVCPRGRRLFHTGDRAGPLYILASGKAALYRDTLRQDKKVISIHGAGQILNDVALQGRPAPASCEMLADSLVLGFPAAGFLAAMAGDFDLTKAVLDSMSTKIRRLYRQAQNATSALRGDKKLAARLWKLSRDHGRDHPLGVEIDLDLPVTYLAALMGSTRENVSRQMARLAALGLLQHRRRRIVVVDREKLLLFFKDCD